MEFSRASLPCMLRESPHKDWSTKRSFAAHFFLCPPSLRWVASAPALQPAVLAKAGVLHLLPVPALRQLQRFVLRLRRARTCSEVVRACCVCSCSRRSLDTFLMSTTWKDELALISRGCGRSVCICCWHDRTSARSLQVAECRPMPRTSVAVQSIWPVQLHTLLLHLTSRRMLRVRRCPLIS